MGRWYYAAITIVFATAAILAALRWHEDWDLFLLGALAYTAATIGYLHRQHHRPGDTGHILGMGASYTVMLTAFYVDNGPHLPLWDHLPTWAFWLIPSLVAIPLILRSPRRPRYRATRHTAVNQQTSADERTPRNREGEPQRAPATAVPSRAHAVQLAHHGAVPGAQPGAHDAPHRRTISARRVGLPARPGRWRGRSSGWLRGRRGAPGGSRVDGGAERCVPSLAPGPISVCWSAAVAALDATGIGLGGLVLAGKGGVGGEALGVRLGLFAGFRAP